jgi:hypothetical protein
VKRGVAFAARAPWRRPLVTWLSPSLAPYPVQVHHSNVYAYVGSGFSICNQLKGHPDSFYSNILVQDHDGDYGGGQACKTSASEDATIVHDNKVFTPTGAVTECGMSLAQWQAAGNDPGTTAAPFPSDAELIAYARAALGM